MRPSRHLLIARAASEATMNAPVLPQKRLVIVGATGMVGGYALHYALDHPAIGEIKNLGLAIKLSATPGRVRTAPPRLGEHTRSVLHNDLGLLDEEISAFEARGIVRTLK